MLQPPPQWPSLPALPLHSVYLCMCHDPGLAPLGLYRGVSSPEARPWPVPQGRAICWQWASLPRQWPAGSGGGLDKGGIEGGGWGIYGQRGQQMPAEATGDLPESILLHPPPPSPTSLLQLVACRFIVSDTYHHCLSCDLFGRGPWVALTFTSDLCRLPVGYVWFCLPKPRSRHVTCCRMWGYSGEPATTALQHSHYYM